MNTLLDEWEMRCAWYARQIDEKAEQEGILPFKIIEEGLEPYDDLDDLVLQYQIGRQILDQYDCVSDPNLYLLPFATNDELVAKAKTPPDCVGYIVIEHGRMKANPSYQFLYFVPKNEESIEVREDVLMFLLDDLTLSDTLVLITPEGPITVDRIDSVYYCLIGWGNTTQVHSFIGSKLMTWLMVLDYEEQFDRQFMVFSE